MVGGANPHETDQQLEESVIKKAAEHQITLTPGASDGAAYRHAGLACGLCSGGLQRACEPAGIFVHFAFHSIELEQGHVGRRARRSKSGHFPFEAGSENCRP